MPRAIDWEGRIGRRLRLRDLHVFFAVVHSGSMAKAAAQLRVKQPSVSKAIGDLEGALGVRLFDRCPHGVRTTIYGDALIECGVAVFDQLKQGIGKIEFLSDPTTGEVRIACVPSIAAALLPSVIRRFSRQYPRAIVHVDEAGLPAQVAGLRERRFDFTITRSHELDVDEWDDLHTEILFYDELVVAAGAHNRWARRRRIDLAELVHERWIVAAAYSWNYKRLMEAFQARGHGMPRAGLVTLSLPIVAELLANDEYITVFPASWVRFNELQVLPVDLRLPPWPVTILTLKNRTLSPAIERFIESLREAAKSFAKPSRRAEVLSKPNVP
jgi:DNA-binding transcriptional LysR family regulator